MTDNPVRHQHLTTDKIVRPTKCVRLESIHGVTR